MTMPQPAPRTADGALIPSKLRLAFSQAADNGRISKLFDPAIKGKIDPHNFVVKRDKSVFDRTIGQGGAAFLYDAVSGEVHTLTMAYQIDDKNSGQHLHTEIGTSLARIAGFRSAQLVVAAMALKDWWNDPPGGLIMTEILPTNGPSLHLYRDKLGWKPVTDQNTVDELHRLCNEYIAPEDKGRQTLWFCADSSVLPKMAQILLDYMDQGVLDNKHTGQTIDIDISALDAAGLTRKRLENIARGITDRAMLQQPGAPAPPQP